MDNTSNGPDNSPANDGQNGPPSNNDQYNELMRRLQYARTISPRGWMQQPQKKMLMSPLMSSVGAMIAFFTVVFFIVWLPENTFAVGPSKFWTPLSNAALHGRQVFLDNGCVYCHSGFSRPEDVATGLFYLYPRASYSGDYYGDYEQSPNLLGTERTGPDLSQEAGYHPNDWQVAHYYDPRTVEPISLMPRFSYLSQRDLLDLIAFDQERSGKDGLIRYSIQLVAKKLTLMTLAGKQYQNRTIADCQPAGKDKKGATVYTNCGVQPPVGFNGTQDMRSYVNKWLYVQNNILGKYGDIAPVAKDMKSFGSNGADEPDEFSILTHDRSYWLTNDPLPVTQENLMRGREIFQERCIGCHGSPGNGQGPGAVFLSPPPIDFTSPDDACCGPDTSPGDLYYRILLGVPGTGMHNFSQQLSVSDIWRVVLFLKTIPNGGLTKPVPKVNMYIQWKPSKEILAFIKKYPEQNMFPYTQKGLLTDPFMIAARSILPGAGVNEKFYIYGQAYTLKDVAALIRTQYISLLKTSYNDAVGRHEAGLPPFSFLCCGRNTFSDVLPIPPTYFTVGTWPSWELAYAKKEFKLSVPQVAENYLNDIASNS